MWRTDTPPQQQQQQNSIVLVAMMDVAAKGMERDETLCSSLSFSFPLQCCDELMCIAVCSYCLNVCDLSTRLFWCA